MCVQIRGVGVLPKDTENKSNGGGGLKGGCL
jgi:hypothetical protein